MLSKFSYLSLLFIWNWNDKYVYTPCLIQDLNGQRVYPFLDWKATKTIPFGAAHIFMAYVRMYLIQGRHCINIIGQLKQLSPSCIIKFPLTKGRQRHINSSKLQFHRYFKPTDNSSHSINQWFLFYKTNRTKKTHNHNSQVIWGCVIKHSLFTPLNLCRK